MDSHKSLSDKELVQHAIKATKGSDRLAELIGGLEGPTVNGWRFKGLPHGMRRHIERILKYEILWASARGGSIPPSRTI